MGLKTVTDGYDCEVVLEDWTSHGITVPAGFRFDGASAPRLVWNIIPPFKRTKRASCMHDYLCSLAENREERLFADRLFYIMLRENGNNRFRSAAGYFGVRLGSFLGIGVKYPHWSNPIRKFFSELKAVKWLFTERL